MKNQFRLLAIASALVFISSCSSRNIDNQVQYGLMIEQYVNYWNSGQFNDIDQLLCEDFELRMTPEFEPERGITTFKNSVTYWRTAYPDFHLAIEESIFSNDAATLRWRITATNTGPGSHPPTGKRIEVPGISVFHFEEGKIKDEWIASNNYYWLLQLGFTLEVPPFDEKSITE